MFLRPRKIKTKLAVFLTTMAVAVGVAGCGAVSGTPDSDASGSINEDAVLRYVYYLAPATLDPATANSAYNEVPLFLMFDRLVHRSPQGEAVPGLATSWEFSPDGLMLTMELREGVKFHDGTDFDAEAVKTSIEYGQNVEASFVRGDLSTIENVEVVDSHTVALHLTEPDVALVAKLTGRAGAIISPGNIERGDVATDPVGTGMYQLDGDYQVGVKLNVERFDDYWDSDAQKLGGVEMTFQVDSATARNSVASGAADAAFVNEGDVDPAEKAGLTVVKGFSDGVAIIVFNQNVVEPLQDERVRLALNLAINREQIVEVALFGQGRVTNQLLPPGNVGHDPDTDNYDYDPERAKKLLAEAGYPDGFSFQLSNTPGGPNQRANEIIAQQLAEVGINVKLASLEGAVVAQQLSVDKTLPAHQTRWTGRDDPALTFENLTLPTGISNPGGHASPKVIEIMQRQQGETDLDKRLDLLREVSAASVEHPQSPIALYQVLMATAANEKVQGLQFWQSGKLEFRGVGMTG